MRWDPKDLAPDYIPREWDTLFTRKGYRVFRVVGDTKKRKQICRLQVHHPTISRELDVACRHRGRAEYMWDVLWREDGRATASRACKSVHEAAACVEEWLWCDENWDKLLAENAAPLNELALSGSNIQIVNVPKSLALHGHPVVLAGDRFYDEVIWYNRHSMSRWSVTSGGRPRQYRKTLAGAISVFKKVMP